jgi:tetrahydromethanopterin S-methyltransferase subunit G
MADELASTLLVYLRRIDEKVDHVLEVLSEHGRRITSLGAQVANLHGDFAGQSLRMDRIERRLDRIEKRLELTPAS